MNSSIITSLLLVLCLLTVLSIILTTVAAAAAKTTNDKNPSSCSADNDNTCSTSSSSSSLMFRLRNGILMPRVGQGLAAMKGELTRTSMRLHVQHGFRHFDGAQSKEWYDDVSSGDELHKIIQESNGSLQRKDFFIVSKVHPTFLSKVNEAVQEMFQSWKLDWNNNDYMDLIMLHYPECGNWIPDCKNKRGGNWKQAWKDLETLYQQGKTKAIGVSNFNIDQLEQLWEFAQEPPHVVQMWLDPYHQARDEVDFAMKHGAFVVSYSSLGPQWEFGEINRNLVFESRVLLEIAEKHDTSIPLVVLSWMLRHNIGIIPRSTNPTHIEENAKLLHVDWAIKLLDDEDDERIKALDGVYDTWVRADCEYHRDEGECENEDVSEHCQATCNDLDY
jgi:diketogulonate reductase-like aldo/keto reductase